MNSIMKNLIRNIFSVINKQDFKVITILGIKIKIFNSETLVNTEISGVLNVLISAVFGCIAIVCRNLIMERT